MRRTPIAMSLVALLAAVPVVGLSSTAQAGGAQIEKVAVVDLERCILETAEGKKAKKELESAMVRSQSKLERKAKALEQRMKDLQAKAAMLSQQEVMRRQQELVLGDQELQQLYQEQQEKLMEKEALLMEKIYKNVSKVVTSIAKSEGVQVVLVKSMATVMYADRKLDITNRVIVAYDKEFK